MEYAIRLKNGEHTEMADSRISRIHSGDESCERLLPSGKDFGKIVRHAKNINKKFSFLTPVATEYGQDKVKKLINYLEPDDEIIINDLGVLNMVDREHENPIGIGRVLGRRLLAYLASCKSDQSVRYYLSLHSPRIRFIETDAFNACLVSPLLARNIAFSYIFDRIIWSATRRCPFNMNSRSLDKFSVCNKECRNYKAVIHNSAVDKSFMLSGNTILSLEKPAVSFNRSYFDRVVLP